MEHSNLPLKQQTNVSSAVETSEDPAITIARIAENIVSNRRVMKGLDASPQEDSESVALLTKLLKKDIEKGGHHVFALNQLLEGSLKGCEYMPRVEGGDTEILIEEIKSDNVEVVITLIAMGADIYYVTGTDKDTMLHMAARFGSYKCLEVLIIYFQDCKTLNVYGESALHLALSGLPDIPNQFRFKRCCEILLNSGARPDCNPQVFYEEAALLLERILELGGDPNVVKINSKEKVYDTLKKIPPLMYALNMQVAYRMNALKHIDLLIKYGAKIGTESKRLLTVLKQKSLMPVLPHFKLMPKVDQWDNCVLSHINKKRTIFGLQAIVDKECSLLIEKAKDRHIAESSKLPDAFHLAFEYELSASSEGIKIHSNTQKMQDRYSSAQLEESRVQLEKQRALSDVWINNNIFDVDDVMLQSERISHFKIRIGSEMVAVKDCLHSRLTQCGFNSDFSAVDEGNPEAIKRLSDLYASLVAVKLQNLQKIKVCLPQYTATNTLPKDVRALVPTDKLQLWEQVEKRLFESLQVSYEKLSTTLSQVNICIVAKHEECAAQYFEGQTVLEDSAIESLQAEFEKAVKDLDQYFAKRSNWINKRVLELSFKYVSPFSQSKPWLKSQDILCDTAESYKQKSLLTLASALELELCMSGFTGEALHTLPDLVEGISDNWFDRHSVEKSRAIDYIKTLIGLIKSETDKDKLKALIECEKYSDVCAPLRKLLIHYSATKQVEVFIAKLDVAADVVSAIKKRFDTRSDLYANPTKWIPVIKREAYASSLAVKSRKLKPKVATVAKDKPALAKTPAAGAKGDIKISINPDGHEVIQSIKKELASIVSMQTSETGSDMFKEAKRAAVCHFICTLWAHNPGSKILRSIHNKLGHHLQFDLEKVEELVNIITYDLQKENRVIVAELSDALRELENIPQSDMKSVIWPSLSKEVAIEKIADKLICLRAPMPKEPTSLEYYRRLDSLFTLKVLYETRNIEPTDLYYEVAKKLRVPKSTVKEQIPALNKVRNVYRHISCDEVSSWDTDYSRLESEIRYCFIEHMTAGPR